MTSCGVAEIGQSMDPRAAKSRAATSEAATAANEICASSAAALQALARLLACQAATEYVTTQDQENSDETHG